MSYLFLLLTVLYLCSLPVNAWAQAAKPALMLAKTLTIKNLTSPINHYWISEKYDGVRAFWNGEYLQTKQGNKINAPSWFTQPLGELPLDGELWIGRGQFSKVSAVVRKKNAIDNEWKQVKYIVFDTPNDELTFVERQHKIKVYINTQIDSQSAPWIKPVSHVQLTRLSELQKRLNEVVNNGGEGLMLNLAYAQYQSGRTDRILKLKPYFDDDAKVLKHIKGKGRFINKMGAILVENSLGQRFKIGTGFSLEERQNPPPIGSIISYKYSGLTKNGLPRFASFLKIRTDLDEL